MTGLERRWDAWELIADRRLIHRALDSEAFVYQYRRAGASAIECDFRVPVEHSRLGEAGTPISVMLLLEIQRQAGYVLAHLLGAPIGSRFVINEISTAWMGHPEKARAHTGFEGTVLAEIIDARFVKQRPRLLTYRFTFTTTRIVATGRAVTYCVTPDQYEVLRQHSYVPAESIHPSLPDGSEISWDDTDRFVFNKADDHVVSMALLNALTQRLTGTGAPPIQALSAQFYHFGDTHRPIYLAVAPSDSPGRMTAAFFQSGVSIAEATVHLSEEAH